MTTPYGVYSCLDILSSTVLSPVNAISEKTNLDLKYTAGVSLGGKCHPPSRRDVLYQIPAQLPWFLHSFHSPAGFLIMGPLEH